MILRTSDFKNLGTLSDALFRESKIRVVFQADSDTPLLKVPHRGRYALPILTGNMTVAAYVGMIRGPLRTRGLNAGDDHILANVGITVISKTGNVPAGQTLIKNISFE